MPAERKEKAMCSAHAENKKQRAHRIIYEKRLNSLQWHRQRFEQFPAPNVQRSSGAEPAFGRLFRLAHNRDGAHQA